jgi:hypothetical protein
MSVERKLTHALRIAKRSAVPIHVTAWWFFKEHILEAENTRQQFSDAAKDLILGPENKPMGFRKLFEEYGIYL